MTRTTTAALVMVAAAAATLQPLLAQRSGRSRGSVSAESQVSRSRSGDTASWQGRRGSGSRTVSQTDDGFTVNKQAQTNSGYSRSVSKDVDVEDREVERSSTATNPWGQSATRNREVENKGGYLEVEGKASTSTGRKAEAEGVVGRNAWGQPAYAGSVNTKYNGNYNVAGARNPYGGWTTAAAGPYGGRVTTTLPSGYRTSTYYGRPYYAYGGAYYRPYTYRGVAHYYPVPVPYYAYYEAPPVGATMLMVAGVKYLVSKDGSYAKQTTSSDGKVVYQSVPAPQGAALTVLPAQRVLVTVAGTTYYVASNTFYRRVVNAGQEQFVAVTAPAGTVFVQALPADFEVLQLNTMYFAAGGMYYVPFLTPEGKELYVLVDAPPQPATAPAAPAASPAAAAPAVRAVAESLVIPSGTQIVVRFAGEISSATAVAGDRFQTFLDQDLAAGGRFVAQKGTRVYGMVTAASKGSKGSGTPTLSLTLTDITVGDAMVSLQTQPVVVQGAAGKGGRKVIGGVALGTAIGAIADGGEGAAIGAAVGGAAGGVAAAAGSPKDARVQAQAVQAFTISVPVRVELMTNVAIR